MSFFKGIKKSVSKKFEEAKKNREYTKTKEAEIKSAAREAYFESKLKAEKSAAAAKARSEVNQRFAAKKQPEGLSFGFGGGMPMNSQPRFEGIGFSVPQQKKKKENLIIGGQIGIGRR